MSKVSALDRKTPDDNIVFLTNGIKIAVLIYIVT